MIEALLIALVVLVVPATMVLSGLALAGLAVAAMAEADGPGGPIVNLRPDGIR
jgi:hypothetical protein